VPAIDSWRVHGVLVTFRRPEVLAGTLARLASQTRSLDHLIVVDNDSSTEVAQMIGGRRRDAQAITYLDPGQNVGPAGGFALGMRSVAETAGEQDWVFLLDDDDPPFFDTAFETATAFARSMIRLDPATGGVGVSGGRFDPRRGRVLRVPDADIAGPVEVDHITGGGLPFYRLEMVRRVGVMRSDLFFGFEELEYGLRVVRAGYKLYADGETWAERKSVKRAAGLLPPEEVSARRSGQVSLTLDEPTWRRYYSLRNLIVILRDLGYRWPAVRLTLTRGLLKPLLNLPRTPGRARDHLRVNWKAIRDAWRNHLGRTVEPGWEIVE
jgi:rhamnopyranosyl-N-acetylglucosaminyl-diphospho-decaprenol beta-1,3/1,4-galactofuranosyltransferase